MKKTLQKNFILLLIALVSTIGLCALSYLTILNYSNENEEQFIRSCNHELIANIQSSIGYGKSLNNYYGIEELLSDGAMLLDEGSIIVLSDTEGNVIATSVEESSFSLSTLNYGEVVQEIKGAGGETDGSLVTYYPLDMIRKDIRPMAIRSILGSLILFAVLILVILLLGRTFPTAAFVVNSVIGCIALQGVLLTLIYQPKFEEAARRSVTSVASYVSSSLSRMAERGINIEEISDLEEFLQEKTEENPAIRKIYIQSMDDSEKGMEEAYVMSIEGTAQSLVIRFDIDVNHIRQNVFNMVLTFAATIILVVIVMKESLALADILEARKQKKFAEPSEETYGVLAKSIRYGNFVSVTFDYLCLSFSALQIREWNQGIFGSTPAFAAALSISICSIADILGMMAMPSLGRKMNTKKIMMVSTIVLFGANFTCFFTHSTFVVIAMRFLSGVGTAGVKQVRNMIISKGYTTEQQRNANLSANNNGVIGGILCGMGLGGVVAGVFGYSATFLAAAVGNLLYMAFESFCLPWGLLREEESEENLVLEHADTLEPLPIRLGRLVKKQKFWQTVVLIVMPQYFLLMIIVCLIPAQIQAEKLPGVVLTYSNLLNGLAGLYLGEKIFELLKKRFTILRIDALMLFAGAISILVLKIPFMMGFFIFLSAILTGFIDGIGTPVAMDLFMGNVFVMQNLDDTESLMIYSLIGSAVMTIAPFILEACALRLTVLIIVGVVLAASGVYIFSMKTYKESKQA